MNDIASLEADVACSPNPPWAELAASTPGGACACGRVCSAEQCWECESDARDERDEDVFGALGDEAHDDSWNGSAFDLWDDGEDYE